VEVIAGQVCANCGFTHGDHEWCTGYFGNG
jgi:hypothetical protein